MLPEAHPRHRFSRGRSAWPPLPGLPPGRGLTGGAVFHDGQAWSTERLALGFALAADEAGAAVASYARAVGFLGTPEKVTGCRVRDELGGGEMDVRARMVLNAAGPWGGRPAGIIAAAPSGVQRLSPGQGGQHRRAAPPLPDPRRRSGSPGRGLRLPSSSAAGGSSSSTPWRGRSIIGTTYHTWRHDPDTLDTSAADVREIVDGINAGWPDAALDLPPRWSSGTAASCRRPPRPGRRGCTWPRAIC